MSAIDHIDRSLNGALGKDGIRRYKTRSKVVVSSHMRPDSTFTIYDALYAVDISKAIKGPGTATFTLTPIQNFLNLIFPNDVVNIYFDIGDGSGWVRTFFGYVDRIEENYSVDQEGKPTTYYRVVCTDFSKAFEKTEIYFNPHVGNRRDFAGYEFAAASIEGINTLASKGIVVGGAPSDVIENIILLLLGFGSQFRLPSSYATSAGARSAQRRLRQRRAEMVRGQLSPELDISEGSMISQYLEWKKEESERARKEINEFWQNTDQENIAKAAETQYGIKFKDLEVTKDNAAAILGSIYTADRIAGVSTGIGLHTEKRALGARQAGVLESTVAEETSLIDIVDTFTFLERRALDGFIIGAPVWQKQGTIISLLRSVSNESVNELFFDLRPLTAGDDQKTVHTDPVSGPYARIPDDVNGNLPDNGTRNGVTYTPAVIMREYPFSTVPGVDLSSVKLSLSLDPNDDSLSNQGIGYVQFGAIFSDKRNSPGRHSVNIKTINVADIALRKTNEVGIKHLDVAVVHEEEIKKTTVGRGDKDHFNLFDMYSDSILGTDQKFYMKDLLPIITPIHILRNGLRIRTVTTRAARFSLPLVKNIVTRTTPSAPNPVAASEALNTVATEIQAPVSNADGPVTFSTTQAKSNFNYRLKKVGQSDQQWKWHHGIDITYKVPDPDNPRALPDPPIPVRAIADGVVYVSAPEDVWAGYGQVIVVKHNFGNTGDTNFIYSVYSHLSSREIGWKLGTPKGNRGMRPYTSAKGMTGVNNPKMVGIPVKKGQILGYLGTSGTTTSRPHLHFEICRHFPGAEIQGRAGLTPKLLTGPVSVAQADAPAQDDNGRTPLADTPFDANIPANQTTFDPVKFFAHPFFGQDLEALIGDTSTTPEDGEQEEDRTEDFGIDADLVKSKEDEGVDDEAEEQAESVNQSNSQDSVDTPSARKQLVRWAVLQDHWYQHNLEYLSGRIDMRGAPEIRVGYRLDIAERNQSYYVEAVQHSWRYPNNMNTSLMVSRGQANKPYPCYVLPPSVNGLDVPDTQRRTSSSRLAKYFITPDPIAIRRSLFVRSSGSIENSPGSRSSQPRSNVYGLFNDTDSFPNADTDEKTGFTTIVAADKDYTEKVILAGGTVDLEDTENADTTTPGGAPRKDTVTNVDPTSSVPKSVKGNN